MATSLSVYSSKSFIILLVKYEPFIYFKLIFLGGMKLNSKFMLSYMKIQFLYLFCIRGIFVK